MTDSSGKAEALARIREAKAKKHFQLDLSGLELQDVPPEVRDVTNLMHLHLENNRLSTLPREVFTLRYVTGLYLNSNQFKELPVDIVRLTNLTYLDIDDNQLERLPPELPQLRNLSTLKACGNRLASLPPEIGGLTNLANLYLDNNRLTSLPPEMGDLHSMITVSLEDNPLPDVLMTAYSRGTPSLRSFLSSLSDADLLYEAKLLVVGEGAVGKTSLREALLGHNFVKNRPTTHGMEIRELKLPHPDRPAEIALHVWDFGGQPVYRITHQFFFSKGALYLVVWWPREGIGQNNVKEWIERIRLRVGADARVLVVATHCVANERLARIDKQGLREMFGDVIVGFQEVDNETGRGIEELKSAIARAAVDLPHMGNVFGKRWEEVRGTIRRLGEPQISYEQFRKICWNRNVDEFTAGFLADLLHDLGQIIYFGDDDGLKDLVVLRPDWLTKAIGFVLEDGPTNDAFGLLDHERLLEIWDNPDREPTGRYEPSLHPFFLRLMEKFDVSYRLGDSEPSSLVAQLVPPSRPDSLDWEESWDDPERELALVFELDEEATGLIPLLIVRTHSYSDRCHWLSGIRLVLEGHGRALLELRNNDLILRVRGRYPSYFMGIISDIVKILLETRWPGLAYRTKVPCPNITDNDKRCTGRLTLRALRKNEADGLDSISCPDCGELLPISSLLYGFDTQSTDQLELSAISGDLERLVSTGTGATGGRSQARRGPRGQDKLLSRALHRMLDRESHECPRYFTLSVSNSRLLRRLVSFVDNTWRGKGRLISNLGDVWRQVDVRLTLWCEYPACPHPVCSVGSNGIGEYVITRHRSWLSSIAPYGRLLVTLLRASRLHAEGGIPGGEDVSAIIEAMDVDLRPYVSARPKMERENQKTALRRGMRNTEQAVGLREFHTLLSLYDSERVWGNLRRVQTPAGEYLWLCPEHYREFDPGLPDLRFSSCFISYSTRDESFAKKLYEDFRVAGIRCWKWNHDAETGKELWKEIDDAIRIHDKLVLIASESSLKSPAVNREIERALEQEDERLNKRNEGELVGDVDVLFPVRIDDFIFSGWEHARKTDVTRKVIADARGWDTQPAVYASMRDKLIHDLRANRVSGSTESGDSADLRGIK